MFKVQLNEQGKRYIEINKEKYKELGRTVELQIGQCKEVLKVKKNRLIEQDVISIPTYFEKGIELPIEIPFEVKVLENTIRIGPVIGILGCRRKKDLTQELLQLILMRFVDYDSIKGLIYTFTEDSVNYYKRIIEGYYYSPTEKSWKPGIFPYPNAIFVNKDSMSSKMYNHFVQIIGNKVFYSQHLSKWVQHQLISKNHILKQYLPHTIPFKSTKGLIYMLNKYGSVYLKPNQSYQGKGMYSIKLTKRGYVVKDAFNQLTILYSWHQLSSFVMTKMYGRSYLIQQSVPFQYKNRIVDFRVYLQKDRYKKWFCPGITTRISNEESIITNSRNRAGLLEADEGFRQLFSISNEESKRIQQKMIEVCTKIASLIENEGIHLGDVAFDVIVDSNLRIWLLELQGGYSVETKKGEIPPHIFYKLLTTPLEYAKTLAGF
ncbi:YheC/YheD family protein [Bacillus suaedaesalsae]|uniref:YheC/YheD family protein n=1 Tax=Bacillus suaedaesalsae TaxID=2810349 RepID=A0ABS2DID3_9BACI|nr:YheC/YheD family protein [Bacillus suaedaesalsae]MBM6618213.1 YheC/YheD family protein [Bacillus suaedaesalsae]